MNIAPLSKLTAGYRIELAGCRLEVTQHPRTYFVRLLDGDRVIRTGHAKKTSTVSAAQALHKAVNGLWGDSSDMAKLLGELAVTAEAHAAHKAKNAI